MKKKRNVIIILLLFISIGVTIAYLQSTDTFQNIFNAGIYKTVTHEEFTSPDNWAPGDTIPKTITTTNEGTIPVMVRVKFEESWTSKNGNELEITYNNERIPILNPNTENIDDWRCDEYCYYIKELAPGESTSSLIDSITFNPNYQGDVTCTTIDNVKTCESSPDGYSGGTYTLNITTQTVQADAAIEVWGSSALAKSFVIYTDGTKETLKESEMTQDLFFKYHDSFNLRHPALGYKLDGNLYYISGQAKVINPNGAFPEYVYQYDENREILLSSFGVENCTENYEEDDHWNNWIECTKSNVHIKMIYSNITIAEAGSLFCNISDLSCEEII